MSTDASRREVLWGAAATLGAGGCALGTPDADAERATLQTDPSGTVLPHSVSSVARGIDTGAAWDDTGVATPACWDTTSFAEGPYYREDAPARTDLRTAGEDGTTLHLHGCVRGLPTCERLADALVELWHADQTGEYDMDTAVMHYRTAVRTGFDGEFLLTTLRPPSYEVDGGRIMPQHFHLRISAVGFTTLVTQLRFADDEDRDPSFPAQLEVSPATAADGSQSASFEFVLL